jgi:hypothetical protein
VDFEWGWTRNFRVLLEEIMEEGRWKEDEAKKFAISPQLAHISCIVVSPETGI